MKRLFKLVLWILSVPIAYTLISLILSYLPASHSGETCKNEKTVFLHSNGIHLDIAFRRDDLSKDLLQDIYFLEDEDYLSFGWGDRDFYLNTPTWDDLTLSSFMNALFFNESSLIHLTRYKHAYKHWTQITVCDHQMESLQDYLNQTFKLSTTGHKQILIVDGYTDRDNFYEARGAYSILNTCNSWVNMALKASDMPAALWTPFDFGVLHWYYL